VTVGRTLTRRSAPAHLALLALLAAGCASTPFARDTPTLEQIQALEQRILELQRKAAMDEIEIDRLRLRVAELETRLGLTPQRSVAPPPPARPSPPAAAADTTRLRPQPPIEERDLDIGTSGKRAPTVPPPAAPRPGTSGVTATPPARPAPAGPAQAEGAPEAVTPAIQALYDRGYTLYHQGHYVDAEASFQRFLQAHPRSELSDNAQYWIGECRYSRGDYRGALAAFRETVARYPEGNKVPDALLKAGESLEKLGDADGARAMYQEVIRRFPQSAVAAVAEERRAKLP
jgi:tol-pal system protein YbgF